MKEGWAGIVCDEIYIQLAARRHNHNVLHDPCRGSACKIPEFEGMAMEMDRMRFVALIVKAEESKDISGVELAVDGRITLKWA